MRGKNEHCKVIANESVRIHFNKSSQLDSADDMVLHVGNEYCEIIRPNSLLRRLNWVCTVCTLKEIISQTD